MVVSNIGVVPDFSSLYTTNAGPYTATIQVALQDSHRASSFEYMDQVQEEIGKQFPEVADLLLQRLDGGCDVEHGDAGAHRCAGEQSGSAPDLRRRAGPWRAQIRRLRGVGEVYIPQDMNYPGAAAGCGPGACRGVGADSEGRGGQRHHGAEFELHDRAQLLGGPQNRQRLLPDRPVLRKRPAAIHNLVDLSKFRCDGNREPHRTPQDRLFIRISASTRAALSEPSRLTPMPDTVVQSRHVVEY